MNEDRYGRRARWPTRIPLSGWRDIAKRVFSQVQEDQLTLIAAGVAFYGMLAIFPAIIALVSVYALVADPDQVRAQLAPVLDTLPGGASDLVVDQLLTATQLGSGGLTLGLVLSVAGVLWSVSNGILALIAGVNLAYDEQDTRGFLRLRAVALLLTVVAVVVAAVALGLVAVFPVVLDLLGLGALARSLANVARWVGLTLLIGLALAALYRYGPDRDRARWRWVSWGAFIAVVLWLAASAAFSLYVSNFSNYHETYGTVAGVAILLLWLYLSSFIALLGAEIDAEIEHQTAVDSTVGPPEPMGQRGAVMADTLGHGADTPSEGGGCSADGSGYVLRMSEVNGPGGLRELPTGELVSRLSTQVSQLVRDELRLALAELKQKGKRAGTGAGLTGAAGLIALFGLGALVIAVIAALALVLPVWSAALIVGAALLVLAGLLALAGIGQVKRATPLMPEQAMASTKRDVETVKESAK